MRPETRKILADFWVIARVVILIWAVFGAVGVGVRFYDYMKGPPHDCIKIQGNSFRPG